ncbi:MAG: hypothetical protein IJT27_07020 [Clostridia bacterium]|nr:hypothetical protein [Clostridia bacterium]
MKKRFGIFLIVCLLFLCTVPAVFADTGPKPSVNVSFDGVADRSCWATLLSKEAHWGPYSAAEESSGEDDVYGKMTDYKDTDGFYFLQVAYDVSDNGSFSWSYYPPEIFKVLLYFPDTDSFAISEIYKTYAFDSYYTFTLKESALETDLAPFDEAASAEETLQTNEPASGETWEQTEPDAQLIGSKSYDFGKETLGFFCRLLITLLLEILIAYLFGYKDKKAIGIVFVINLVTQVTLNLALNVIRFYDGPKSFVFWYAAMELVVFLIEAGVYFRMLPTFSDKKAGRGVLYAAAANLASFAAGMALSFLLPEIF